MNEADGSIRIVIVDDHPIVRSGLRSMLEVDDRFVVAGEAGDGHSALETVAAVGPDVVLMDLRLGREFRSGERGHSGVDATCEIRRQFPEMQVLVLTTYDSDSLVLGAIEAGAAGYMLKDAPIDQLTEAVCSVAAGRMAVAPELSRRLSDAGGAGACEPLSLREIEMLKLTARGFSNKEIASACSISEATVKTHLINVFGKLEVSDRTSAVTKAISLGLFSLEDP